MGTKINNIQYNTPAMSITSFLGRANKLIPILYDVVFPLLEKDADVWNFKHGFSRLKLKGTSVLYTYKGRKPTNAHDFT